jgi:Flp pilus assembly protein TadD
MGLGVFVAVAAVALAGTVRRDLSPAELEAVDGLGWLQQLRGETRSAASVYTVPMQRTGGSPFLRLGLARVLAAQGAWDRAEEQYRTVLAVDADSPVALFDLSVALCRQGRQAEAAVPVTRFVQRYGTTFPALAAKAAAMLQAP